MNAGQKINGGGDMLRMVADYLDGTDTVLRYLADELEVLGVIGNFTEASREEFLRLARIARGEEEILVRD